MTPRGAGVLSRTATRLADLSVTSVDLAITAWALPAVAGSVYLGALSLLARNPPAGHRQGPPSRVVVVIPAHNEEHQVADTIRSIAACNYPADFRHILVVADNCSDRTAEVARAAGAEVLVRDDTTKRGKGFALAYAFDHALADPSTDAVVVVDADTLVSANLLEAFAARLERGADAVQADYAVRNVDDSWRTVLAQVAFTCFHLVRSEGRERLGLSTGLRGNGMAFSRHTLQTVPHDAFSVVEDLEYGIRLGRAGIRVHHAGEARVVGDMPSTGDASLSQRQRWEGGRRAMRKRFLRTLATDALRRRDKVLADLAIDVALPPLGTVVMRLGTAFAAGSVLAVLSQRRERPARVAAGASALGVFVLGGHVARGWQLSGTGSKGATALAQMPRYLVWKLANGGKPWRSRTVSTGKLSDEPATWVRTQRSTEQGVAS